MSISIRTPRGRIKLAKDKTGEAVLVWRNGFGEDFSKMLNDTQSFIDISVLRLSDKYVPFRTGMLKLSGTLGTKVGSGEVRYIAPYARRQYYSNRSPGSSTGRLRGPKWFERMKTNEGKYILEAAAKFSGGDAK